MFSHAHISCTRMHTHACTHIAKAIATASLVFLSRGPHRNCSPNLSDLLFQHEHRNWVGARALKIPVESPGRLRSRGDFPRKTKLSHAFLTKSACMPTSLMQFCVWVMEKDASFRCWVTGYRVQKVTPAYSGFG